MNSLIRAVALLGAVLTVSAGTALAQNASETQYLTGLGKDDGVTWEFFCTAGRNSGTWTTITVPSCWELKGFGTYNYGHDGSPASEQGLYRRTFNVPAGWSGRRVELVFEGSMTDTTVTVNGNPAGATHQGGFTEFRYDISALLVYGASNLVEVTVAKRSANTSINQAEREADYWIFGGIYRPVYLIAHPAESIRRSALNPLANGTLSGTVHFAGLSAAAELVATLRATNGTLVGSLTPVALTANQSNATFSGNFAGIVPWSMENPALYDLTLELTRSGNLLHSVTDRIGFRTVQVIPGDGFYLNGVKIRMKGVNRHTFWPDSGRTSSAALSAEAVALIQGTNMNAVRMSHYPPDKHFLAECDARGLLVINELPGWQSPPYDNTVAPRLVQELVERDVNRPSVVLWANGNEGGWNLTVDDDYALHDPQARPVIHPSSNYSGNLTQGGMDTTHYPTYSTLTSKLGGSNLYLPTEFLHGLYDGGHAAGLQDYWNAMRASSKGVGGFLWVFADEGVVRTDTGNSIDTDGNHAPDGIVGPYHQKEPSYEAIREIWSPVVVPAAPVMNASFTGNIGLLNDYYFTNIDQCAFRWELVDFPARESASNGATVIASGNLAGPSIAPQANGTLSIPLPGDWQQRGALRLIAFGPGDEELRSWTWQIRSNAALLADNLPAGSGNASVTDGGSNWLLNGGPVEVAISKTTGRIVSAGANGTASGISNGPRVVTGTSALGGIATRLEGATAVVETTHTGNLSSVIYRMHPSGALEIAYALSLNGTHANIGLTFDYPAASVAGFRWLGDGPQPVWRNRVAGGALTVSNKTANNAIPGQVWTTDPVFRGYHANFRWGAVRTANTTASFLTDTAGLFFRLLSPSLGASPQSATFTLPAGDLSLLHGISAHGNKFHTAANTGPSGALNTATGNYAGRFFLVLDAPPPPATPPAVSAVSVLTPYRVRVAFTKPMGSAAFDPASYSVAPSRVVHAVVVESSAVALLDLQPLAAGTNYTLAVSPALADAGNLALTGNTSFPITWQPGLAAHWPFDAGSGGVSPDVSGNSRNATLIGSAAFVDGRIAAGLDLPGSNGTGASFEAPSLTRFTLSAWVRADGNGTSAFPRLVSFGADNVQWFLDFSVSANRSIGLNAKSKGDWRSATSVLPAFGTWMHLAVSYDSTTAAPPVFYLDGVAQTPGTSAASSGNYGTAGTSGIGNRVTDNARPFDGVIDDLRIHDRVLSAAEIAELAAQPATQTFAEWIAPFSASDPTAGGDPDYDGVANGIERLWSRSPVFAEGALPANLQLDGGNAVLIYPVPDTYEGVSPVIEASTSLAPGEWDVVAPGEISAWRDLGDRIEYRVERPLAPGGREFLRLRLP